MTINLPEYQSIVGEKVIQELLQLAQRLKGKKIVHINSTREGGGVAEILSRMIPLSRALGLDASWETIEGENDFFKCTKTFHNLLQGEKGTIPPKPSLKIYEETNAKNAKVLHKTLQNADIVFIHDPQPLPLISHFPERKGKWFWRCHIDLSNPSPPIWDYLKKTIQLYDASIFSLEEFAQPLPHPIYFIPPSIDPLSEKNIELDQEEVLAALTQFGIDPSLPYLLQVSRFDRFKDPLGVIEAYQIAKKGYPDLQLVLAGSGAKDDPEGAEMLREVKKASERDPGIYILLLPPTAHRTINALQRGASIIIQKSLKEGFGLTVTEGLWKKKAVIGGNTGGIKLQIIDQETGFLVNSPKEAADRIHDLLEHPEIGKNLGIKGHDHVLKHFLITRHLRDYLTVILCR